MDTKTFEGVIVSVPQPVVEAGQVFVLLAIQNSDNDVKIFCCFMKGWATDTVDAAGLLLLPVGHKIKVRYGKSKLVSFIDDRLDGEILRYE